MIAALSLSNVFSPLAKLLAAGDVYGFVPCDVSRPVRGVGITMVLGAFNLIIFARCAAFAGVPAMNLSASISVPLFDGIGRLDPVFFLLVPGFLLSAAFLASYILVRRARHMHPVLALRCEEV
jgi:hypothetical protein